MNSIKYILLTKNSSIDTYTTSESMHHDFYLLSLLVKSDQTSLEQLLTFYKSSYLQCWTTNQLFCHKQSKNIQLFSVYDLATNDELCLPTTGKLILSKKNFMQCLFNIKKMHEDKTSQIYIVIDERNYVHVTTDITSVKQNNYINSLLSLIKSFFIKI
ncbi:hypothetical protein [Candidatus Chromulinivorax destructor]|uniref:Uncharacterized protein n=1 Tax=Candidatus Chromulinivorax destructor TaxID=2066483 RepID=A0A345ZC46_9BACT|nr:hypothetical protein [Candidatus Chromulinivorax destructor]AXK60863.1 hypothetical protein C0J27_03910 [Candidatus Chromulinivorax destructor]